MRTRCLLIDFTTTLSTIMGNMGVNPGRPWHIMRWIHKSQCWFCFVNSRWSNIRFEVQISFTPVWLYCLPFPLEVEHIHLQRAVVNGPISRVLHRILGRILIQRIQRAEALLAQAFADLEVADASWDHLLVIQYLNVEGWGVSVDLVPLRGCDVLLANLARLIDCPGSWWFKALIRVGRGGWSGRHCLLKVGLVDLRKPSINPAAIPAFLVDDAIADVEASVLIF